MKKSILLLFAVAALAACKSEPTLQKYFVEKSDDRNFVALDLSPTILNPDPQKLTPEQKQSLEAFDKMNILAFKLDESNKSEFEAERARVDAILKDEKYQELIKVSNGKEGGSISFVGDVDRVEEFILYGKQKEMGLIVVRILGDEMKADDVMNFISILEHSNPDLDQLKPLQQMFAPKT